MHYTLVHVDFFVSCIADSSVCTMSTRAFSAVAQIESDAILAGLLDTESILSTQQMVKW